MTEAEYFQEKADSALHGMATEATDIIQRLRRVELACRRIVATNDEEDPSKGYGVEGEATALLYSAEKMLARVISFAADYSEYYAYTDAAKVERGE